MMEEAKEKDSVGEPNPPAPAPAKVEVASSNSSITYKKDDKVEFWSNSHKCWLPAVVINTDMDGKILIDLKPNTWITKEQQAQNVKPRIGGVNASEPRQPRVSASPSRGRSPSPASYTPKYQRSPSQRSIGGERPGSREARPGSRGASPMVRRSPSGNVGQPLSARGAAGSYKIGDLCEYWSTSHGDWLPATIINTDAVGQIIIDLKPNTWIPMAEQTTKIRPRRSVVPSVQHRPSSGGLGSSPQLPRPPIHRSPSWGAGSPSHRAPSPSRAMTPLGARGSSPSGRAGTPSRRDMTPRRASSREPSPHGHGVLPRIPPRISQSPLRVGGSLIAGS